MIKDKDGKILHCYDCYLAFNKKYPETAEVYKRLANDQKNNPSKNGVYTSQQRLFEVSDFLKKNIILVKKMMDSPQTFSQYDEPMSSFLSYINAMPMFAGWRNSLDIYRIDPEIFEEMIKSPIPEDTPCEIFTRLPSFTVYVQFPRAIPMNELLGETLTTIDKSLIVHGFWAYLGYEPAVVSTSKDVQVNICLDYECDEYKGNFDFLSMVIQEGKTVKEATELVFKQYEGNTLVAKNDQKALFTLLPILLWLCAKEPDITNIKGEPITIEEMSKPKYTVHKKTGLFVPPSNPTIYNLGERLGGEIRQFKEAIEKDAKDRPTASKRPHIRKGHWHGYWKGTTGNKVFTLKWLSATFVGFN